MDLKHSIKEAIAQAIGNDVSVDQLELTRPSDLAHGDYTSNIALILASAKKQDPKDLAKTICQEITLPQEFEKCEVAGPGFINFYLKPAFFTKQIAEIIREGANYGKGGTRAMQKVMVEFTDPNPFKPFHIGHLMSNAIGESLSRLIEFEGAEVSRANWQGDVGLHVAKTLWGLGRSGRRPDEVGQLPLTERVKVLGEAYAAGNQAYEEEEEAKKEIQGLNQKIFAGELAGDLATWYEEGRKWSLDHFEELYSKLGTSFDHYFFEGKEGLEGVQIVKEFMAKGIFEESDGAIIFPGEKYGLHTRVFLTSAGLPTYEAKELGLNRAKFEKVPDLAQSIIITGNEQRDYFKVLLEVLKRIYPAIGERTRHLAHGLLRLTSGKMSSRQGNVITGEALLEQVQRLVLEKMVDRSWSDEEKRQVANAVAVGAIKYAILKAAPGNDIVFDLEQSVSLTGDSGPYLQYTHVRTSAVLEKAAVLKLVPELEGVSTVAGKVERLLSRFPEVVEQAARSFAPNHIVTYLVELAGAFNSYYANQKIIVVDDPATPYRLAVVAACQTVLTNGLYLLGIKTPSKM